MKSNVVWYRMKSNVEFFEEMLIRKEFVIAKKQLLMIYGNSKTIFIIAGISDF